MMGRAPAPAALSRHSSTGSMPGSMGRMGPPAPAADEVGNGEEDFEAGMQQNAADRDAADADQDGKLDFTEFCAFVRDREEGNFTEMDLRLRFMALDADGSGKVDMSEYLQWSLKDALSRSSSRVVDLFRAWDEDRSGLWHKRGERPVEPRPPAPAYGTRLTDVEPLLV